MAQVGACGSCRACYDLEQVSASPHLDPSPRSAEEREREGERERERKRDGARERERATEREREREIERERDVAREMTGNVQTTLCRTCSAYIHLVLLH